MPPFGGLHPLPELGKGGLDRIPDDIEIDIEVSVGHAVSHPAHLAPGNFGMGIYEVRIRLNNLCCRLAENDHVQDHGLLRATIVHKVLALHAFDIGRRSVTRLEHMFEVRDWFADNAQRTTSGAAAASTIEMFGTLNVLSRLQHVRCPTLVIHAQRDAVVPLKAGRVLASGIPNAELAILDSCNHILLEREPAWIRFKTLVNGFLPAATDKTCPLPEGERLTRRQQKVLSLLGEGLSNREIAERLGIGEKTVRNHVSTLFDKLGVHSRARAIVLARDLGTS